MISLELQIVLAVLLDLMIGDPRWFPHPVRLIGKSALAIESTTRKIFYNTKWAGIITAVAVVLSTGISAMALVKIGFWVHPLIGDFASIYLLYVAIAPRDLAKHSMAVFRPLLKGDITTARRAVGMMVGRDTDGLDEAGLIRATVESVAENLVDGVTAPLLYGVLLGPVGAMVYRAINTLDASFGYRNERYINFGWASARLDDLANFIPARLTGAIIPLVALLLRHRAGSAWQIMVRDRRKHTSPNAGFPEAAMAGALGVELGGASYYSGQLIYKPTLGHSVVAPAPELIRKANTIMFVTTFIFLAFAIEAKLLATAILVELGALT